MEKSNRTKRIVKNTTFLYIRLMGLMLVNFYTSRVILEALGFNDFALYAIVGGIVSLFSIISNSLSASISRFIVYELGKGGTSRLQHVFSTSVIIQLILAIGVILLAETIGLWYVNCIMVCPIERLPSVNITYQLSVITFCINLLSVPYNATIIAHERMSAYAYISLLEAVGQLLIAWFVKSATTDRLTFYALSLTLLAIIVRMVYVWFCKSRFSECSIKWVWDIKLLKEIFTFAGWNIIGTAAGIIRDQGNVLLINGFFPLYANAAMAITMKANGLIISFVQNFVTAINPQITKSYVRNEFQYMFTLTFQGARFSFYLLLILTLPVLLNTRFFLEIWLASVPLETPLFVDLTICLTMSECLSYPLITLMLATGKIRNYQIIVGGLLLLNIPVSYLFLYIGFQAHMTLVTSIAFSQCCLFLRLYMLKYMVGLNVRQFLKQVYFNTLIVAILAGGLSYLINCQIQDSLKQAAIMTPCSVFIALVIVLYIGMSSSERLMVRHKLQKFIRPLYYDKNR